MGNRSSYSFESLTGGASYTYQVRTVNGAGSSGWSAPASATATTPPGRPDVSVAVTGNGTGGRPTEITITRSDVSTGGGADLAYTWVLQNDRGDSASGTFTGRTAAVDVSGWNLPFRGSRVTATVTAETSIGATTGSGGADVAWGQAPGAVTGLTITPDDPVSADARRGVLGRADRRRHRHRLLPAVLQRQRRSAACQTATGSPYEQRLDRIGLPDPQPGDR